MIQKLKKPGAQRRAFFVTDRLRLLNKFNPRYETFTQVKGWFRYLVGLNAYGEQCFTYTLRCPSFLTSTHINF
jgi:hypothetical protein